MVRVKYIGHFAEESGYGVAARGHALALARADCHVIGVSLLFNGHEFVTVPPRNSGSARLQRLCRRSGSGDVTLLHMLPPYYPRLRERGVPTVGLSAWETRTLPRGWHEPARVVDEIWVPSAFSVEAFRSATGLPIRVVPHPVAAPPPAAKVFPGVPSDAFVFASVMEWQQRKNPLGLVRAFSRAFQGRRDVMLVMKLGRRLGLDEVRVARAIAKAGVRFGAPPVHVFFADGISRHVIHRLLRRADAYVSLHRAEGFGLTIAEAMAAGLPTVATGYSGNLEYTDDSSGFLVRARLVPAVEDLARQSFFEPGMEWAEPSHDDAVDQLRACVDDAALRGRVARAGEARVRRDLSMRAIGEKMRKLLPLA
jgi:glycosyltransferase involved in cell wall biosynthesis